MSAHTPGPWKLGAIEGSFAEIDAPTHGALATVVWKIDGESRSPECEANAAFIVRACNAHDELIATLEAIAEEIDRVGCEVSDEAICIESNRPSEEWCLTCRIGAVARVALAKVQP